MTDTLQDKINSRLGIVRAEPDPDEPIMRKALMTSLPHFCSHADLEHDSECHLCGYDSDHELWLEREGDAGP